MPISNKYKNDPEVQKALADAWLNIRVDEDKLGNPLNWPAEFDDNPEQYITWVMAQPEYFYFVCKEIMGIELSPTQCVVLKELWNRKFPMYIASRGFGKALRPNTLVKGKDDWVKIKDLAPGDKVYGGHGKLCKVTNTTHIQKDLDFYKVTFQDGRTIECCKDHQWKVWDVTLRKWFVKSTIDIFQDYFWIKHKKDRQHPHREYKYAIPLNEKIENEAAPPIFSLVYYIEYGDYFEYRFEDELSAENYSLWKRSLGLYVELDGLSVKVYGEKPVNSSHAKSKLEKVFITDIEYVGKGDGMCIMVDSPDHTYIAEDYIVTHNSFLLGVYTLLRLMFMPGRKIVIAGAAFRQSRIIFEYMENIYKNSPLLRDLFGPYKGTIKHETDAHRFYFNESVAIAIPIGTGEKIRGLRANDLICVTGDTIISTEFGDIPIKEYTQGKVLNGFLEYEQPSDFIVTEPTYVYKITTDNNKIIKCSSWHRVLSRNGWCIAKDLSINDEVFYYEDKQRKIVKVKDVELLPHKEELYDFHMPETSSFIGNGFVQHNCDEFNSINRELFETVLVGFTAVSSNPIQNQKNAAAIKLAKEKGWWEPDMFDNTLGDNQLIISGTAGYSFQPFYNYWKDWHDIIASKGDTAKLESYFKRRSEDSGMDMEDIAKTLNHKHYSIIRIPIEKVPEGIMDADSISRARATMHSGTYINEYSACFSDDSNGFFKRAVIENCTVGHKPIHFKSCGEVDFEASLYGHHERSYVIGIDPASEVDNLAVVIVEMWPEHRRIVYCWTINKARQREEVKAGLTDEHDYNSYCARKIRNLMRRFKTARIMMDSQGGGYAIMEAFRNRKNIEDGEQVLLPAINEDKPAETDMQEGLHIVELVNFRDNKWLGEANHTMRKDLENRLLLFPRFDAVTLGRAEYFDENTSHMYDSLEDTTMEIEELKDELSNIIQTKTSTGLDKWDTPEQVMPGGKKGRMKKDRYSALLMANMGARILMEDDFMLPFESWGDFSKSTKEDKGGMYTSSFFSEWAEDFYSEY